MNEIRRQMMLKIADDEMRVLPILYHADRLTRCDEVLMYLIKNNITGIKLLNYFQDQNNSILNLLSDILRRVNKESKKQKILAGKDYKV